MANLPAVVETNLEQTEQYITFQVGQELFGVDIMCVEEIIIPRACTAIPRTPKYFMGIINLRGEVISIVDMRIRFGLEKKERTPANRIIVIHTQGFKLGMLVDSIRSIVTLKRSQIRPASVFVQTDRQKYISSSYRLPDETILLMLEHRKLINEEDFHIHKEVQTKVADNYDRAVEVKEEVSNEIFLVGFSIGNEKYAIESLMVEEIILLPEITEVPEMEDFVEGIFHLRESVIPVIRLSEKLELAKTDINPECHVIIVKVFGIKVGLIVDQITEVYLIKEDEIVPPPINLNPRQVDQLKGVIKITRADRTMIVMLLKLDKLFSFEEQDLLKELDMKNDNTEELDQDTEEEVPILEFMLSDERYAIPVSSTNEIIPLRQIVPVPKSPPYIKGVINLRGEVISIVDLPLLVERLNYQFTADTKILVVNPGNEVAGLIVEKVIGIRKVRLSSFEPPSDLLKQRGNIFIHGIGKDDKTDEIVVLMDLAQTLYQAQGNDDADSIRQIRDELHTLDMEDRPKALPETT